MPSQRILELTCKKKLPWPVSFLALAVCFLICFYFVAASALATAGYVVFAGRIVMQIPLATCANPYTCSACLPCGPAAPSGCGDWDQWVIAPIFGSEPNSSKTNVICQVPSFIPNGSGRFMVGNVVLGYAPSELITINDGKTTNIWSVSQ